MSDFVMTYRIELIFLHVVGAVVWVGGMIAMRFAAHPAFMDIADPIERLPKIAKALKRLFLLVMPFVLLLAITGAVLTIGYGIKHTDFHYLTHIKEGIWTIMFINLVAMMLRRSKAEKMMREGNYKKAGELLGLIGKFMVPVNIALGMAAIVVGVLLRINL